MKLIPFDYAVRNLGRSPRRLAGIVLGNALVVLLVLAAGSFVGGMRKSLTPGRDSRNVILLATGSEESIERSTVSAATPGIVAASLPGIRMEGGAAFVSPEILSALIFLPERGSTRELRALVRGVTPAAFLVHPRVEVTAGRAPVAGANELLAGSLAAEKMGLPSAQLDIGQLLWFEDQQWTIVGRFQARGSVMNAELWVPLPDLQLATKRDGLSCVVVALDDAEFADVDAFTKTRVDLELSAIRESDYYASLLRFYRPVQLMIWVTAVLIALAGVLGGLNTLYSAFSARVREIAMLQALGFARRAIVVSLVQEALLAASLAVLIAAAVGKLTLEGFAVPHSMGVFELVIDSGVLVGGAVTGLLLGLLGALPPAWRCLRMPIPEALKSL